MGPTERSGVFWSTFGTVTSESEVDKRQLYREQRLHLCQRRTRGETSATTTKTTTATTTNPPQAKKSERRRGRIFSIWADGNLRLLHIGLCATEVLCNSRARLLPSLSRPSVSLLLPSLLLLLLLLLLLPLSYSLPFSLWCINVCMHARAMPSLSFSLHFLFLVPPLSSLSLYDETNEGIFNPANHQRGTESRTSHFSYLVLLFFFVPRSDYSRNE